jgi:hypothetical protein
LKLFLGKNVKDKSSPKCHHFLATFTVKKSEYAPKEAQCGEKLPNLVTRNPSQHN